ncbi:MAG: hypothetical protein P8Y64_12370 [Gammaproteobacteria bacterium]
MRPLTFTRLVLLEARSSRLLWLAIVVVVLSLGLAGFAGSLALTDQRSIEAGLLGSVLRGAAVLLVMLFVLSGLARDFEQRFIEVGLALPVSRGAFYLGRLGGYLLVSSGLVLLLTLPLWFVAKIDMVLLWALSLLVELWLVSALAMFFGMTLRHLTSSFMATLGAYLLARVGAVLEAMAVAAASQPDATWSDHLSGRLAQGVMWFVPDLGHFARSEWLMYGDGHLGSLGYILLQGGIYLGLLIAAGMVDLYRRNF